MALAHWDDVEAVRETYGEIDAGWVALGRAAGSIGVGVNRLLIPPGARPTPVHCHGAEEEIFVVLAGSGLSWQDGQTYAVAAGDVLVHRASAEAHTLRAGPDGLDVLAFGERVPAEACHLPRAGVLWLGPSWVPDAEAAGHPFSQEIRAGPLDWPEPSPRPDRIAAIADVRSVERGEGASEFCERDVGRAIGSVRTGLSECRIPEGCLGWPPHCHASEEELFVVLDGAGTLLLGDEEHELRRGHVIARPAGTGTAHAFRGGTGGLTYLAYGTRVSGDISYFPRSGKVHLRGVGVIGRLEPLEYWAGERGP